MLAKWIVPALACSIAACTTMTPADQKTGAPGSTLSERVKQLSRGTAWRPVASIPAQFDTQHPQGMVKIGDTFYISSVEITTPTKRFAQPQGDYDRDTGAGVGHLFKVDMKGNLLADLKLGEGSIYHPGGIDYDGRYIWVAVAEYRPNSRSIIYRVDPATMQATEVFRYGDHIGGIVHNRDGASLHGVSWGSRRFYRWTLDGAGRVSNADVAPEKLRVLNPAHYIDYQDCKYLGNGEMLCTGLTNYQIRPDAPRFALGGIEIVDLATHRVTHQVPIQLWTTSGLPMTQNPVWIEPTTSGLRAYFMPEDGKSTLYVYDAEVK
jgi:hypothetical protein